jgi:hypothetical protein
MPLSPGEKLGPYEILSPIGAGGMGEVWKARDTRLDRTVAIKVSKDAFTERFEREAKAVAALNHPNICTLYDVGPNFLVMEYIDGAPLKGPLPLDKALRFAAQICDALDAAHKRGITHRDLKPANILVTKAGIKLLDFGLAKLTNDAAKSTDDVTVTMALTGKNQIVGTLFYMSPEQLHAGASSQEIDGRSDIFSFGLVLYEMLTGKRAFEGASPASVIAAILERPAPSIADIAPPALDRALNRCLEKDPENRWQTARDLKAELEWIASGSAEAAKPLPPGKFGWVAAGVFALIAAALAFAHFGGSPRSASLVQTEMPLPDGVVPGYGAISPDGTKFVVSGTPRGGKRRIYLRHLNGAEFAAIQGTEGAGLEPFWSPDSQWIAFGLSGNLMKWNTSGGQAPQVICSGDADYGSWSEQGVILFNGFSKPEIQRVPAAGGAARNALELDSKLDEQLQRNPRFLPGGRAFLFNSAGKVRGAQFFATLDGKVRRRLFDNLNSPLGWAGLAAGSRGLVAYVDQSQLFARPFDPVTGDFEGEADLLASGVHFGPSFSFSRTGYLAYLPTPARPVRIRWYSRTGEPGETVSDPGDLSEPVLSPDAKRILFVRNYAGKTEVWQAGAGGGTGDRIASGQGIRRAVATTDGNILYGRREGESGIMIERPADPAGAEKILAHFTGNRTPRPLSISANGKVVMLRIGGAGNSELFVYSRPDGKIRTVPRAYTIESALSPDGTWLAEEIREDAATRLVVMAVPSDTNTPLPTTVRGIASLPDSVKALRWSADGKELFVLTERALMSLPIEWIDGAPRAGTIRKLFDAATFASFDVTADGQRFIVAESEGGTTIPPIVLVQNWQALLRK